MHLLGQRRSAGNEKAQPPAELAVDGPEEELPHVEWGAVAQLAVQRHRRLDRGAHQGRLGGDLLREPPVQELPQRRNADHRLDLAALERLAQALRGQLVEVGDLRAEEERNEQAAGELEGVVERQHAEQPLAHAQIEERRELRGQRGEVAVRQEDALGLSRGAAGEQDRGDVVRRGRLPQRLPGIRVQIAKLR